MKKVFIFTLAFAAAMIISLPSFGQKLNTLTSK